MVWIIKSQMPIGVDSKALKFLCDIHHKATQIQIQLWLSITLNVLISTGLLNDSAAAVHMYARYI